MTFQTGQWLPRPPLLLERGRVGLAGATARGRIYAIAGFAGNDLFDSVESRSQKGDRTWHEAPKISIPRANCAADTLNDIIYVVGGQIEGDIPTDSVQRLDPHPDASWGASLKLPRPRSHAGVAAHGALLYVAGGGEKNGDVRATVAYDPVKDKWIERAPLQLPKRHLLRLVSAGEHLYAIGGLGGDDPQVAQKLVDRYDPASDHWTRVAHLNEARANCGAIAFGRGFRHILAVGGVGEDGTFLKTSEVYDIEADEWQTLDVQLRHARAAHVCVLEGRNRVLAIGGALTQDDGSLVETNIVEAIRIRVSDDNDNDDDDDDDDDNN